MTTVYVTPSKVARIYQKKHLVSSRKVPTPTDPNNIVEVWHDDGWFVRMVDSWEARFISMEKPDLEVGQLVDIVIRPKVSVG